MSKEIPIKCGGQTYIHIDKFKDLQGSLKSLSKDAYERLKKSILKYGFRFPVFFVEVDGDKLILDAHQRIKTLRKMTREGFTIGDLPSVKIDAESRVEAKEILLALNSRFGEIDEEGFYSFVHEDGYEVDLNEMLDIFTTTDFDMDKYLDGYEIDDSEEMEVDESSDEIPDKAPAEKVVIKEGDVITLGKHRVMCGSSESEIDVMKLLNGSIASHVITDPPYGIEYQSSHRKKSNKSETFDVISNDDIILEKWMPIAKKYSDGWIMFWVGWQNLKDWISVSEKHFGDYTNIMVWRKTWGMGDITGSFKNGEMGLIYNMGSKLKEGKRPSCIFEGTMNLAGLQHSNQKPISLFVDMMDGLPDGSILDLFGGSGSNLIACDSVDRDCFMMELSPSNVQLIVDRFTGHTENYDIGINGNPVDWNKYKDGV